MQILKKIQYNSPVTLSFVFLSLAILILNFITGGKSNLYMFVLYRTNLLDPLQYVRLFTYVLGHADITHYFNNMLMILLLGPMIEEKYGAKRLILMILITALVSGVIHLILLPHGLLGASGIVFMLILLSSYANYQRGRIPLTLVLVVVIYLGREIIDGFTIKDNISQISHIIGGACGGIFGFYINRDVT